LQETEGAFGARGALLKAGIAGGVVTLQFLVLRHNPSKRLCWALAIANCEDAGVTGSVVWRNWHLAGRWYAELSSDLQVEGPPPPRLDSTDKVCLETATRGAADRGGNGIRSGPGERDGGRCR
jgi:hypothetical protein